MTTSTGTSQRTPAIEPLRRSRSRPGGRRAPGRCSASASAGGAGQGRRRRRRASSSTRTAESTTRCASRSLASPMAASRARLSPSRRCSRRPLRQSQGHQSPGRLPARVRGTPRRDAGRTPVVQVPEHREQHPEQQEAHSDHERRADTEPGVAGGRVLRILQVQAGLEEDVGEDLAAQDRAEVGEEPRLQLRPRGHERHQHSDHEGHAEHEQPHRLLPLGERRDDEQDVSQEQEDAEADLELRPAPAMNWPGSRARRRSP